MHPKPIPPEKEPPVGLQLPAQAHGSSQPCWQESLKMEQTIGIAAKPGSTATQPLPPRPQRPPNADHIPHNMTTAAREGDTLSWGDCAAQKNTQREESLLPHQLRGRGGQPTTELQEGCCLSSVNIDIRAQSPESGKVKDTHQARVRDSARAGCAAPPALLREKMSPGRSDKCSARLAAGPEGSALLPHTSPSALPLSLQRLFFHFFFFSRAPNPRHMTFC